MVKCQIESCENESERTLGKERISEALKKEKLEVNVRTKMTKVKICKEHYRRIKKHIKKKDKIERLRWSI
jgi:hypothetical protein